MINIYYTYWMHCWGITVLPGTNTYAPKKIKYDGCFFVRTEYNVESRDCWYELHTLHVQYMLVLVYMHLSFIQDQDVLHGAPTLV